MLDCIREGPGEPSWIPGSEGTLALGHGHLWLYAYPGGATPSKPTVTGADFSAGLSLKRVNG